MPFLFFSDLHAFELLLLLQSFRFSFSFYHAQKLPSNRHLWTTLMQTSRKCTIRAKMSLWSRQSEKIMVASLSKNSAVKLFWTRKEWIFTKRWQWMRRDSLLISSRRAGIQVCFCEVPAHRKADTTMEGWLNYFLLEVREKCIYFYWISFWGEAMNI